MSARLGTAASPHWPGLVPGQRCQQAGEGALEPSPCDGPRPASLCHGAARRPEAGPPGLRRGAARPPPSSSASAPRSFPTRSHLLGGGAASRAPQEEGTPPVWITLVLWITCKPLSSPPTPAPGPRKALTLSPRPASLGASPRATSILGRRVVGAVERGDRSGHSPRCQLTFHLGPAPSSRAVAVSGGARRAACCQVDEHPERGQPGRWARPLGTARPPAHQPGPRTRNPPRRLGPRRVECPGSAGLRPPGHCRGPPHPAVHPGCSGRLPRPFQGSL